MAQLRPEMILADCLDRLQSGATIADCLARAGDRADDLAPMLESAAQLQAVRRLGLSVEERAHAKAALRATLARNRRNALASQDRRQRPAWNAWWGQARGLALAGMLVAILFVGAGVTSVAASRPGDVTYPLRTTLERAPALWQTSPAGRAQTELNVAERRLADVTNRLQATGQVEPAAVNALLAGDEAAARHVIALPDSERAAVSQRLATHAETLSALARSVAQPGSGQTLEEAAGRASALAERLAAGAERPIGSPTPSPTPSPSPAAAGPDRVLPSVTPTATAAPTPTPAPAADVEREPPSPQPTPAGRVIAPGQRATALSQTATAAASPSSTATATATRAAPAATASSPIGGPSGTVLPGLRATALAQTAIAQPPSPPAAFTPPPAPTEPADTGGAATPAPGRRATALAATAAAQTPVITPTPTASAIRNRRRVRHDDRFAAHGRRRGHR